MTDEILVDRFEDSVKPGTRVEVTFSPESKIVYVLLNDIPTAEHPEIESALAALDRTKAIRLREALDAAIFKLEDK